MPHEQPTPDPRAPEPPAAAGSRPETAAAAAEKQAAEKQAVEKPAAEKPAVEKPVAGTALAVTDVRRVWADVLVAVQKRRRTTQILLESATVVGVAGATLQLSMPSAGMAKRVVEAGNADLLRAALREVLGVDWTIRCDAGESGVGSPPTARTPPAAPADRPPAPAPAPARPTGRPARGAAPTAPAAAADRPVLEPPEDDDEIPEDYGDPEAMAAPAGHHDPEEAAMTLLAAELGATRVAPDS